MTTEERVTYLEHIVMELADILDDTLIELHNAPNNWTRAKTSALRDKIAIVVRSWQDRVKERDAS